jgi:hypothetical protein
MQGTCQREKSERPNKINVSRVQTLRSARRLRKPCAQFEVAEFSNDD